MPWLIQATDEYTSFQMASAHWHSPLPLRIHIRRTTTSAQAKQAECWMVNAPLNEEHLCTAHQKFAVP
jgi:hypothetical protein